jgi:hypothetical protein
MQGRGICADKDGKAGQGNDPDPDTYPTRRGSAQPTTA